MGLYEEILAETNDPAMAARIVRRLRPKDLLKPSQARALAWLRKNDPTGYTMQQIGDELGCSPQQAVQLFGSLVMKGYCKPDREDV